jgi:hypothetical protein
MEEDIKKDRSINVNYTYPNNPDYEYSTSIEVIDLDAECDADIASGNGFLISAPKKIKKDIKNIDGIYSSRFGQKLGDQNPFADRYSCECGALKSHINHGITCPVCGTICKFVDDNFKMFGWIRIIDEYHLIHPKFYDSLNYIFGASKYNIERKKIKGFRLENIIHYSPEVDENGFQHPCEFKPDGEPFYGIGMIEFYNRFDEILDYYIKKYPKKIDYYNEIMNHRDIIFCHSIPVFTTHLRPADIHDNYMYFEPTNGLYNMINTHACRINKVKRQYDRDIKQKNSNLYKLQMKWMKLTDEIMDILQGKRGQLRMLVAGRYNFSCRAVIRQDAGLRCDQVLLPYVELVKCLQQRIINVLIRSYNITPGNAYEIWRKAVVKKNDRICEILDAIIAADPEGIPVIINRNPTLAYGSVLQMFCVGYTDTLTMSIPLQVLPLMNADFDGDVLNVMHIINKAFLERCYVIFNPRNAMYIGRVDGKLNAGILPQRDTIINANTFIGLGRKNYSKEDFDKIAAIKEKQQKKYM